MKKVLSLILCAALLLSSVICATAVYEPKDSEFHRKSLNESAGEIYDAIVSYPAESASKAQIIQVTHVKPFKVFVPSSVTSAEFSAFIKADPQYRTMYNTLVADVNDAFFAARYDHPEMFWLVSFEMRYTMNPKSEKAEGGSNVTVELKSISLTYHPYQDFSSLGTIEELYNLVDSKTTQFAESIKDLPTYDKIKKTNEYVKGLLSYDYDSKDTSREAFSAYKGGKGVCEAYSKLFKIILDKLGIPCVLVFGSLIGAQISGNHMWDLVKMDNGEWYNVDVTLNDNLGDTHLLVGSSTNCGGKVFSSDHHVDASGVAKGKVLSGFNFPSSSASVFKSTASGFQKGDVDRSRSVTSSDARLVLRAAVGLEKLDEEQKQLADMDNNNKVTTDDARLVLRKGVGLD